MPVVLMPITGQGTVPTGGATNQVLSKIDATNYNVQWATPAGGGNVSTSGTITTGQHARWASATAIESISAATAKTDLALNNVTNDAQIKASDFPAPSVDSEVALFSGTSGKIIKRATATGIATLASGVLSSTPDNHANWDTAFTDRNKWDGGATGLNAATGRTSLGILTNASTAQQQGFASDTYLTGSLITVAAGAWTAGTSYKCVWDMGKTAAGVANLAVNIRIGTAGTTADTAVLAYTVGFPQTATADQARCEALLTVRTTGTAATIIAVVNILRLNATAVGFVNVAFSNIVPLGAATTTFNSTTATKIGVSVNGGTSFVGTTQLVTTELIIP